MPALTFDLTGMAAVVTGGTSGIGKAITESLLHHGARVVTGSSSDAKVSAAAAEFASVYRPDQVLVTRLDVTDYPCVDEAMDRCMTTFGRLDILVNCAGMNKKMPTLDVSDEQERRMMDVNYFGAVYAAKAAARRMIAQDPACFSAGYSIINICSVTSFLALSEVTAYACSKGALLALTRQLAVEWIRHGIRTNAVAPGFVPADQNRQILQSGDRGRRILENTPMQRFGEPCEIAGAVTFLCSDAARFINGHCLNVDGGFMIHGVSDAKAGQSAPA